MLSFEDLIGFVEEMPESAQLALLESFGCFSDHNSPESVSIEWDNEFVVTETRGFLVIDTKYYHVHHIIALIKKLESISFPFPKTLQRNKDGKISAMAKREWVRNNRNIVLSYYPNAEYQLFAQARPTTEAFEHVHDIAEYLRRKFVDNKQTFIINQNRYELLVPHHAKVMDYVTSDFSFPKDKITDLLDKYSANRCISKKAGLIQEWGDILVHVIA